MLLTILALLIKGAVVSGVAGLSEIKAYLASQRILSFGLAELYKIIHFEGHSFDCANCIDF